MPNLPPEHDCLQRFVLPERGVRGELIHLSASYRAIYQLHDYPPAIAQLLGQALAASALLSATIKFEGSLILQTQTDGLVNPLVVQATHNLHLRGMADWETAQAMDSATPLLGNGHLVITLIPNKAEAQRYQGIVALQGDRLADALMAYFWQSEQLPSFILLASNGQFAAGMLLQQMPMEGHGSEHDWEHVEHLAQTLTPNELLMLPNQSILRRLFHAEDIKLYPTQPVCFRCRCSIDKMQQAVISLGYDEAMSLLSTQRCIDVTCEFCRRHYEFDQVDVAALFNGQASP